MDEMDLATIDPAKYGKLCADAVPKVIESEEELQRLIEKMEALDFKETPTVEERALSDLLMRLIQDYDDRNDALPDTEPYKVVLLLMEKKGLRQADLIPVFGSRSVASSVLNGKRQISKAHARKLGEFFSLSPAAFL